jgi:LysR family glycine cleavage system transcriptional activator
MNDLSRRLPPMHSLAAFESAARHLSFSRAGEELCITQSAVSHRIRQLEQSLGARLFERRHKRVELTRKGEQFLLAVRQAMQQMTLAAQRVAGEHDQRLRVTVSPAVASQIVIPNLSRFLALHPRVGVDLDTSSRVADLSDDSFDVGLRLGVPPWSEVQAELLVEERVLALASPAYARRFGRRRERAALEQATLIHTRPFTWNQWFRALGWPPPAGASTVPALSFVEAWAAVEAAEQGMGVVLAPQTVSLAARQRGRLIPFIDAALDAQRHYYAVYAPDSPKLELIQAFVAWTGELMRAAIAAAPIPARTVSAMPRSR